MPSAADINQALLPLEIKLPSASNGSSSSDTILVQGQDAIHYAPSWSSYADGACETSDYSYRLVILATTLPLWTCATLYLLSLLVHLLRRLQTFKLYDRCRPKNAHFRYDFHLVVGKHSLNYNTQESHVIVDLLDDQQVSSITIQIPGPTIFGEKQVFMYKRVRTFLRCLSFSIYRRHPIKDITSIRIAHTCSNPDSRLFVYGLNLYDLTGSENKFFPVTSVIKYRGTHWALNTTFEPKNEINFSKLGCECFDPFGCSIWPTYVELVIIIFYLWSAVLYFGSLIPVDAFYSVALHALTVTFISGSSAAVIAFIYIRFVKYQAVDQHSESTTFFISKGVCQVFVIIISLQFWIQAYLDRSKTCDSKVKNWSISSFSCAIALTILVLAINYVIRGRRMYKDNQALADATNLLMRTNSKTGIEFDHESFGPVVYKHPTPVVKQTTTQAQPVPATPTKGSLSGKKQIQQVRKKSSSLKKPEANQNNNNENETLDNAFKSDGAYIKTKNRNSISQYV